MIKVHIIMRSYWNRVGPHPMTDVLRKRRQFGFRHRRTPCKGKGQRSQGLISNARNTRGYGTCQDLGERTNPAHTLISNQERIDFYCLNTPSLWYFVMTAPQNIYSDERWSQLRGQCLGESQRHSSEKESDCCLVSVLSTRGQVRIR